MKKIKGLLCLILALSVSVCQAACGKAPEPQSQAAPSGDVSAQSAAASSADSSESENPQDKYEPVDLQGRTITIAYNWQHIPITTADKLDPKTATKVELQDLANMKRIEKKYNCHVKYINIPYDQLEKKLTVSVMAGTPCADLINIASSMVYSGIKANLIQCLDDIVPDNCDMFHDQKVLLPVKFFGKTYAMSTYDVGTAGALVGFNRDLIKKLGQEEPDQLYKEGKWTWDSFMKIAKAATQDTDGDGKIDQWGWGCIPYTGASLFVVSNGGCMLNEETKKTGLSDPKTVEALDFINKIYNVEKVGYIKDIKANWWSDDEGGTFKNGNIAMFYTELYMIPTDPKLKFTIGCVPTPKGPSDTEGKGWIRCDGGVTIPKGVKDPQNVYKVFEELSNAYGADFKTRDKDAKKWLESCYPTEGDISLHMKNSKELYKIDHDAALKDYTLNNAVDAILKQGKTPAQAVKQYTPVAQAQIDKALKNG